MVSKIGALIFVGAGLTCFVPTGIAQRNPWGSGFSIGGGTRPIRSNLSQYKFIAIDRSALPDTLFLQTTEQKAPGGYGVYFGLETYSENDWFLQIQGDWGFGLNESDYFAIHFGIGRSFSRKAFSINPCLNIWLTQTRSTLDVLKDKTDLYIRSGDELFDTQKEITVGTKGRFWGISPNIFIGIGADNVQLRLTAGYLAGFRSHQYLTFRGKDREGENLLAAIPIDEPDPIAFGPNGTSTYLKSVMVIQGLYLSLGIFVRTSKSKAHLASRPGHLSMK